MNRSVTGHCDAAAIRRPMGVPFRVLWRFPLDHELALRTKLNFLPIPTDLHFAPESHSRCRCTFKSRRTQGVPRDRSRSEQSGIVDAVAVRCNRRHRLRDLRSRHRRFRLDLISEAVDELKTSGARGCRLGGGSALDTAKPCRSGTNPGSPLTYVGLHKIKTRRCRQLHCRRPPARAARSASGGLHRRQPRLKVAIGRSLYPSSRLCDPDLTSHCRRR